MSALVPVREAARGRWRGILPALGVDSRFLNKRNGPCPMCGGHDRWSFDDLEGRGTWLCRNCGAGDGLKLAMAVTGLDFHAAAERVEALVGTVRPQPILQDRPEPDKRAAMRRLWASGRPITPDDPAGLWLRYRVGLVQFPAALRFVPGLRYAGELRPAMIALAQAPDGSGSTVHRTFLTSDGRKAPVDQPRMVMPGHTVPGHAVRLFDAAPELGIAEGVETALAAASLFGVPCWSALNAGGVAKWIPPEGTTSVVIFADNDALFAGQEAAMVLARRLAVKGIQVRVEIPPDVGTDWNDQLNQRSMQDA